MMAVKYELTVMRNHRDLMSLDDVAARFGIHPGMVRGFLDAGLLEPAELIGGQVMLDPKGVKRIRVIQSLRCDLGINLAGIAVIFDLLDRLNAIKRGGRNGY